MDKKTVRPSVIGGRAGGEKYIVHNILFKFAVDSSNLFDGSNWAARKVCGEKERKRKKEKKRKRKRERERLCVKELFV